MTDKTDIAALRPSERAKLGFVTDDNTGGYYVAECEECGNIFPSQTCDGGGQIADTGDYGDCYCPLCGHVDPQECDNANLVWNVQQLKIVNLTKQLEAERPQRETADRAAAAERLLRKASDKAFNEQYDRAEKAEASVGVLEGIIARKEFDSLKGDQIPVGWVKVTADKALSWDSVDPIYLAGSNAPVGWRSDYKPVYNRPQKPVISKEKLCDWLEDNFDIDDSQRDAFANCFAHHCNCIVKEGN